MYSFISKASKPPPVAYQSSLGVTLSHQIQHPIFTFFIASTISGDQYLPSARGLKTQLPCDTHVLNLKTLPKNIKDEPGDVSTLLLHRIGYDCHFNSHCSERRVNYFSNTPISPSTTRGLASSLPVSNDVKWLHR